MKHVGRLMTGLLVLVAVAVSTAIAWAFTAGGLSATGAHFAIAVGALAGLVHTRRKCFDAQSLGRSFACALRVGVPEIIYLADL